MVLRTVGDLFRHDDVPEIGDVNRDTDELAIHRPAEEVVVAVRMLPVAAGDAFEDVEVTGARPPGPESDVSQRAGRDRWEDDVCRRVPQAGVKLAERGGQPIEILRLPREADVQVPGLPGGPVKLRCRRPERTSPRGAPGPRRSARHRAASRPGRSTLGLLRPERLPEPLGQRPQLLGGRRTVGAPQDRPPSAAGNRGSGRR